MWLQPYKWVWTMPTDENWVCYWNFCIYIRFWKYVKENIFQTLNAYFLIAHAFLWKMLINRLSLIPPPPLFSLLAAGSPASRAVSSPVFRCLQTPQLLSQMAGPQGFEWFSELGSVLAAPLIIGCSWAPTNQFSTGKFSVTWKQCCTMAMKGSFWGGTFPLAIQGWPRTPGKKQKS